jgi:peptidoglycan/xylan/chitin deacetylase (PgdA/CDA1 family)/murein DD-endopeptidase MepM/ murein hydrolase activator NlpD
VRNRIALVVSLAFLALAAAPVSAGSTQASSASARPAGTAETPKFLTLPFKNLRKMQIQQTWTFTDGQYHQAIDYIKGTVDNASTWKGFPVVAAAGGKACGEKIGRNGCVVRPGTMGNRVLIKHRIDGKVFYTFYNHLKWIESSIPLGSRDDTVNVKRGQIIGWAGASGNPSYLIHLHFQLLDKHFQPLDPYGIYGKRTKYPNPKGTNGKHSRAANYWTANPPILPEPPADPPAAASAAAAGGATGRAVPVRGTAAGPRLRIPDSDMAATASRSPARGAQYITHGNRNRKWIALTFDADMYPFMYRTRDSYHEYDMRLVRLLKNQDVPATMFLNGLYVKAYPQLVQELLAEDPKLELANHTWDHAGWTSCGNTDPIQPPMTKRKEVTKTSAIIDNVTGVDDLYFRYPGGCYGPGDNQLVKSLGVTPIGWDCYFGDALGWSAERQIANVKNTCRKGSIVITHFNNTRYHPGVYKALKALLPWWKEHGWKVVSVGTMLGRPTPPPN